MSFALTSELSVLAAMGPIVLPESAYKRHGIPKKQNPRMAFIGFAAPGECGTTNGWVNNSDARYPR
jgi:hypothetical protein